MDAQVVAQAAERIGGKCFRRRGSPWQTAELGLLPHYIRKLSIERLCDAARPEERELWERVASEAILLARRAAPEGSPYRLQGILDEAEQLAVTEQPIERNGSFQHARGAMLMRIQRTTNYLAESPPIRFGREKTPLRYQQAVEIASLAIVGAALLTGS